MTAHRHTPRPRGVSLVEALVAMAVMAFGMLALVGVQATMRLNSDVAKQRGEATRIATEEIERLRGFTTLASVQGEQAYSSYDAIASGTPAYVAPNADIGNAAYTITRTVRVAAGSQQKSIAVRVDWIDRSNQAQSVTLESVISGTDPVLSGLLAIQPTGSAPNQRGGRHASIPPEAVDLGDHRSAFKPFDSGLVVWVFDHATGLITSRCANVTTSQAAITATTVASCPPLAVPGRLVSGVVQFNLRNPLPDPPAAASENPAGPALPLVSSSPLAFSTAGISPVGQSAPAECFANSPATYDSLRKAIDYYCLVYPAAATPPAAFGWGGKLDVKLASAYADGSALPGGTAPSDYRVCRYTLASSDFTVNANHPKSYCMEKPGTATVDVPCTGNRVTGNLVNQNFLVIAAVQNCPTDLAANPSVGDLVNSNTLAHPQP